MGHKDMGWRVAAVVQERDDGAQAGEVGEGWSEAQIGGCWEAKPTRSTEGVGDDVRNL